jgi:transposase
MLTRMTEEDWATVLEGFRACRSRRGAKGRNDRIFLEAVHYFCVHNITWRALPAECGNWNSVWKRFWRLSQAGVFEAFFDALAAMSQTAPLVQMLDSTVVRAHVSAAGAKGGQDGQALGRSRGGFSTKIDLKADLDGRPLAFHLTEGQAGDSPQFEILLDLGPDITPRAAVGDKGYDAKANRSAARERSICPVIPFKSSARNRPAFFPKALYRARARIEHLVGKLRQAQALQAHCAPLRENEQELRILRRIRSGPHHRQIRPHGLVLQPGFARCSACGGGGAVPCRAGATPSTGLKSWRRLLGGLPRSLGARSRVDAP